MDFIKQLEQIRSESLPGKRPHLKMLGVAIPQNSLLEIENEKKVQLPEQYKEILIGFGAFSLSGSETNIVFNSIEESVKRAPYDLFDDNMKGIFIFGTDNGGNQYFFDLRNIAGKGIDSVYIVYPGNASWKHSQFIGKNLVEVLNAIIEGENFEDAQYMKQIKK